MYPVLSDISRNNKLKLIEQHCSPQDAILEVGSGSGWFAAKLREHGYHVTTQDLVAPADIMGDINRWKELGIQAGSFDVVIALEVIEHTDCLAALEAVCKPGGLIMLSSPHPHWDWVMKTLEFFKLTQKRTSPHDHLIDFQTIQLPSVLNQRPGLVHQFAIFINQPIG